MEKIVIKNYIILLCLSFCMQVHATVYYVSNSGDDDNNGLTEQTAWKSISKVNLEMKNFVPGDSILFNKGDIFHENLIVSHLIGSMSNVITFGSYGTGKNPLISGDSKASNWTHLGSNIYETKIDTNVYQLFHNHENLQNAGLENLIGYQIQEVISQTQFKSENLVGVANLIGSTVNIQTSDWYINTQKIIDFDSATGTVTLEKKGIYDMSNEDKFFIINHRQLLKNERQWSYNEINGLLHLKWSSNPEDISYSANESFGIKIYYSNNIQVRDIDIQRVNEKGIWVESSSNILIENATIQNAYRYGIYAKKGSNVEIRDCIINSSIKTAIHASSDNVKIDGNKINNTGLFSERSYKGYSQPYGIEVYNPNAIVQNNEILNSGYIGIRFYDKNCLIKNNFIQDFCQFLSDGGAIYNYNSSYSGTGASGTKIRSNIIIGSKNMDPDLSVFGIYLDDMSHDVEVSDNSVAFTKIGIFLHNNKRQLIKGNHVYNSFNQGIGLAEDYYGGDGEMTENIIENNHIFIESESIYDYPLKLTSVYNNYEFGIFNGNKYYAPYSKKIIGVQNKSIFWFNQYQPRSMSLAEWQSFSGNDMSGSENEFHWESFVIDQTLGDNLVSNEEFNQPILKWSAYRAELNQKEESNNKYLEIFPETKEAGAFSNVFSFDEGSQYILEFDVKSEEIITIRMALNKIHSPYTSIFVRPLWSTTEWQHYAIPIQNAFGADDMRLNFYMEKIGVKVLLDNVRIQKVKFGTPPKRSFFALNNESNTKLIDIPKGNWEDFEGKVFSDNISLDAFSSRILIKTDREIGSIQASAGEDQSICIGESLILEASGGASYQWSTGATTQSIEVRPETTTTYTVTVSEGSESATDEVVVSVNEVVANAGADRTITEGESISLTATGGDSYLWSTGATTETITVSPNASITYTVTATKRSCEDADDVRITVNPSTGGGNPVTANAGSDVSICYGESTTLTASGGSTYSWNTGATGQSITVSPNITTTYTVKVSEGSESATDDVIVTVNEVEANAGADRTIVEGETIILVATGGDSYLWSTGDKTETISVSPNTTETYTLTAISGSCQDSDEITVNVAPIGSDPIPAQADAGEDMTICLGESVVLNGSGGDTYKWSNGFTTEKIEVSPTRTTTFVLSASRGGVTNSNSVTITVENCNGISEEDETDLTMLEMNIYPNPAQGELFIRIDNLDEDANFIINDTKGSLIYSDYISAQKTQFEKQINLSRYSDGLYFVRLYTAEQYLVKKVIVQ